MDDIQRIEEICKKLKPVIGKKADVLYHYYLTEDWKGRKELEQIIQMIALKVLNKNLAEEKILLIPPNKNNTTGDYYLGNVVYNGKELYPLYLRDEDFVKHIGIFSITGEGKTNVAMLLALQLLEKKVPFLIIDWKRTWRGLLSLNKESYPVLQDVKIFTVGRTVSPFNWNPFRPPPNVDYRTWLAVITEVLEKSHLSGPGSADFFLRIFEKKFKEIGFDKEVPKYYPNFYDGLKELEKEKAYARELLWKQSTKRVLKSFIYGPHSSCFNSRNPIKLETLLDKPIILELDQELPKPLRVFLTELILRWIHLFRLSQGETDNLNHVLFLEECHNLFPKTRIEKETSNSLENVYREIRAFGQGLVSITQHTSLLPTYILGNSHTQITLGLQHEDDINASKKSLFLERGQEIYLDKLKVGEGIVKVKGRINPCLVRFPLVPVKKGEITDGHIKKIMQGYLPDLPLSSTKDDRIGAIYQGDNNNDNLQVKRVKWLLVDIEKFPIVGIVERYQRLNLNNKTGNELKNKLIQEGLIKDKEIITKKGNILLLGLTLKGKEHLRNLGYNVSRESEGLEHKFWKLKIAEYYKSKDYDVAVEEIINGRPDILIKKDGKSIAIEIETGLSDPIWNIERNLRDGIDTVISVAVNEDVAKAIKDKLQEKGLAGDKMITITTTSAFNTN